MWAVECDKSVVTWTASLDTIGFVTSSCSLSYHSRKPVASWYSNIDRGPHSKELRSPVNSQVNDWTKSSSHSEAFRWLHRWLTSWLNFMRPCARITQLNHSQIFNPQKLWDDIVLLSFEVRGGNLLCSHR